MIDGHYFITQSHMFGPYEGRAAALRAGLLAYSCDPDPGPDQSLDHHLLLPDNWRIRQYQYGCLQSEPAFQTNLRMLDGRLYRRPMLPQKYAIVCPGCDGKAIMIVKYQNPNGDYWDNIHSFSGILESYVLIGETLTSMAAQRLAKSIGYR